MKRILIIVTYLCLYYLAIPAQQRPQWSKLSPMLRQLIKMDDRQKIKNSKPVSTPQVCAFIRINDEDGQVLQENGCRSLARFGNIHIASIPIHRLRHLSLDPRVLRIEANRGQQILMDSVTRQLHATQVHDGIRLPQAFTGQGVVMGVMDIGFDLTHPNFYNRDTTEYRIQRLWDMISADTIGSTFYVGRDYVGRDELLNLGCSRDGLEQTHGTHTLGSAAGSGYQSSYRGMAPESDICLVANATTDDIKFIDPADYYKYTFATDALGFKYIFDYAQSQGKPCVISFSEGSGQDFWGYDQLYYEILDSLVGPGRILVAAAGNQGRVKSWFKKEKGLLSEGTFLRSSTDNIITTFKSADDFTLRVVSYADVSDTLLIPMNQVLQQEDSTLEFQLSTLHILVEAYPSCYHPVELCYDVTMSDTIIHEIGNNKMRLSVEVIGVNADVEVYRVTGAFTENNLNPALHAGEGTHNVHSPSSSPSVISVGATMYRQGVVNYLGQWKTYEVGGNGGRATFSSIGPTMDGRIKPDVMGPGVNVISSYSSFYMENNPSATDLLWDVEHFTFNDRTYAWNSNSGTSMSCPAVAGGIALWLQACPTLSPNEVFALIQRTSRHNAPLMSYPNCEYGYGEMDVYAGLLDLLGLTDIKDIEQQPTKAAITMTSGRLHVGFTQAATMAFSIRIHNMAGRQMLNVSLPAGQTQYEFSLPTLPSGIYAVSLSTTSPAAGSTLIRF